MFLIGSYIQKFKEAYVLTRMAFYFRALGVFGYGTLGLIYLSTASSFIFYMGLVFYLFLLTWPFVGLLLSLQAKDQKKSELRNTLIDAVVVFLPGLAGLPLFFIVFGYCYILIATYSIAGISHGIKATLLYIFFALLGFGLAGFSLTLFFNPTLTYFTVSFSALTFIIMWQVGAARVKTAKRAAGELEKEQRALDNVSEILSSIGPQFELKQTMEKVLKALQQDITFDGMVVFVHHRDEKILSQQFIFSKFKNDSELSILTPIIIRPQESTGFLADAAKNNDVMYHESINPASLRSTEDIQLYSTIPYNSLLSIPINVGERQIGMVIFLFRKQIQIINRSIIEKIQQYIYHISHLLNNELLYKQSVKIVARIQNNNEKLLELSQKVRKYLSPQISHHVLSGEIAIKRQVMRKYLTVYCSDIENFTQISEQLAPEELQHLLNSYLETMTEVAIRFGGTIDKYIGDMITIFFGDPDTEGPKKDALNCLHMAMAMNDALQTLREKWLEQGIVQTFKIRNAISSGILLVGNIGGDFRQDYTVYGDDMNYAMMLQTKAPPGGILMTESTHDLVKNEIECIPFDKPIEHSNCIYQNFKAVGDYTDAKLSECKISEEAKHYSLHVAPEILASSDMIAVKNTIQTAKSALDNHTPFYVRFLESLNTSFKNWKKTD